MSKTMKNQGRQGDVLLVRVNNIPENLEKTKQNILAFGEATGHSHTLDNQAVGYADKETELCSCVEIAEALALLEHQEHGTIQVSRGKYDVIRQVEYSPKELRNVAD